MNFSEWLIQVDQIVHRIAWVSLEDLIDWDYRQDYYESGYTPAECAAEILAEEGYIFVADMGDVN